MMITFLTDSAISGPIPSPGNKVAVIGVVEEQKALATEVVAVEVDRLPISRFAKVAAMVISSTSSTKRTQRNDSRGRLSALGLKFLEDFSLERIL